MKIPVYSHLYSCLYSSLCPRRLTSLFQRVAAKVGRMSLCLIFTSVMAGCELSGDLSITPVELEIVATDDQNNLFDPRDEPYIGFIRFKATFGDPGSIIVTRNTELTTIDTSAGPGDVFDLSGIVDPININGVELMAKGDLVSLLGEVDPVGPTIAGAIYMALDHDNPGKGNVRTAIESAADDLQAALVSHVGGGAWGLGGLGMLQALEDVVADLRTGGTGDPTWFETMIGDDMVGSGIVVYIGMTSAYYDELEPSWEFIVNGAGGDWDGCPTTASAMAICPIKTEDRTLRLNETVSDGHYKLRIETAFTPAS
jgi:hypothetical protein